MKKFTTYACVAGMVMGLMAPMTAVADDTISVTVEAYDYTAGDAGVSGASSDGKIMSYTVEVAAGSTDAEAITAAFNAQSISITGVADKYVTEINGLTGAYPGGWMMSYNGDAYSNWGISYLGANADGVLSDGDVIRFDYTVDGGADIGASYYGNPILTSITIADTTTTFSKETVYDSASGAGITSYYVGADKAAMTGTGTEADPFVISTDASGSDVAVSYVSGVNSNYVKVEGLSDKIDLSSDVSFTLTTNGGLKSYYTITSTASSVTGDTTNLVPFIIVGAIALVAIVFLAITGSKSKKKKN
ncbi:MAG: hypothetical protein K6F92_03040 [Lachnospiraceae bacterium]|nr:hypothetical protein [Lachnospiraceae bacterium]